MPTPDAPDARSDDLPLAPSPGRRDRATTEDQTEAVSEPPRKQHGDALLDGSGSRQGRSPDPALDAQTPDT